MPGGDGKGPPRGRGAGSNVRGAVRGTGPEGTCVCPFCGAPLPHRAEIPCTPMKCPQCGKLMIRR